MIIFNSDKLLITTKTLAILLSGIFLSGCMGIGGQFDCNVNSGGRCAPMHHINRMANYGAFNEKLYKVNNQDLIYAGNKRDQQVNNVFSNPPLRSNEEIQKVWIAPYEDIHGNYHGGSYVYSIVKQGRWIGSPTLVVTE
jgi:hypothetical protein